MLFDERSFRIAIGASSLLPYVALALMSGSLRSWPARMVRSLAAPLFFLLSFFLLALLFTNFELVQKAHSPVLRMVFLGAGATVFLFPGLILVIATTLFAVAFRSFEIHYLFAFLAALSHAFFIHNVIMFLSGIDWLAQMGLR
jgi:hypothetical protein